MSGLANPQAAWALVGLVAILVIHLLQRQRTRVVATTAFLLEGRPAESLRGRRFERLRRSAALVVQLLAVALLALALARPQAAGEDPGRLVVLLDDSASMGAFEAAAVAAAAERIGSAGRRHVVVMGTDLSRPPLHSGDPAGAIDALGRWQPDRAGHDLLPAIEAARAAAGPGGRAVLVTDHAREPIAGVERLAVGRPLDNVGFVHGSVEPGASAGAHGAGWRWRALVRNHGRARARREVRVTGAADPLAVLDLAPGAIATLGGAMTEERIELALEPDALAIDDRLPLVRPEPRPLRVRASADAAALPFVRRLLAATPAVTAAGDGETADLTLVRDGQPAGPAIVLGRGAGGPLVPALALAHPLTRDLQMGSLLAGPPDPQLAAPEADVLLTSRAGHLVMLRDGRQLVVAFDVARGSAARNPAFVVLVHRFVEAVRAGAPGRERANVETAQELSLGQGAIDRAPSRPGFFRIEREGQVRLEGAAHFADAAEADLASASSIADPPGGDGGRTAADRDVPWSPLVVVLGAALVVADGALRSRS